MCDVGTEKLKFTKIQTFVNMKIIKESALKQQHFDLLVEHDRC
jgi:hypothetical protein